LVVRVYHVADEMELVGVDMLTVRVDHRVLTDMNQQEAAEHEAECRTQLTLP
jgi:hypothetical protein